MSKFLSAAAVTEFDNEVKQAYQGAATLRSTVTVRSGVVGDTYKFAGVGKGLANQKATQADVTPMDITYSRPTATLENWNAPEYSDIFDQAEVNFDEKAELAQVIAKALGRREDQIIIDALNTAPGFTVPVGAAGLTLGKITTAAEELNDKGVEMSDRYFAVSAAGIKDMLDDTTITSADFNTVRLLMSGEVNSFMGFQWKMIETRAEGGLPLATADRSCFAYHKSAIGLAVGAVDNMVRIDWVAQKTSWLCNGLLKAGAVTRDSDGIVKVVILE